MKGVEDGEVEASAIHSGVQDRSGEVSIGIATFTVDQGYSFAQAGKQLGVLPKLIQAWAKKYRVGELVNGAPRLRVTAEQQELSRLRQEVQRLKMERDILKNRPRGIPRPLCIETLGEYSLSSLGQWPSAFWR